MFKTERPWTWDYEDKYEAALYASPLSNAVPLSVVNLHWAQDDSTCAQQTYARRNLVLRWNRLIESRASALGLLGVDENSPKNGCNGDDDECNMSMLVVAILRGI